MDVSTLEIAIIAIVVMGAVVLIVFLMKHQMRRCRWCMRSTTPVELLSQGEGEEVRRLIRIASASTTGAGSATIDRSEGTGICTTGNAPVAVTCHGLL